VKIGYLDKPDSFAVEMLKQMKAGNAQDGFLTWLPGEKAPAMDLEVLLAIGKVGAEELEGQTKLGLLQTASAGYDGVNVEAATKAGIWVASAPTTKTGNRESVAEFAVLLMLAVSRRLNEKLAFTRESRSGQRSRR
jgi:lactate dehydrogenase-like 2-hydroxyacid dehydrogenase